MGNLNSSIHKGDVFVGVDTPFVNSSKARLYLQNNGVLALYTSNADTDVNWIKKGDLVTNDDFPFFVVKKTVSGTNTCTLQSMFKTNTGDGNYRQTIFIFGNANNDPVHGILTINNNGGKSWSGTGDVTASIDSTGRVTVTLPKLSYDDFIFISAGSISA